MRIRELLRTGSAIAVVLLVSLPKHGGLFALFTLPFLGVSFIRSSIVMVGDRSKRLLLGTKMALWLCALATIASVHGYMAAEARADADAAASAVERYKVLNGVYPPDLAAAGVPNAKDIQHRWMLAYMNDKGTPALFYAATFTVFDVYNYNFEKHSWAYLAD